MKKANSKNIIHKLLQMQKGARAGVALAALFGGTTLLLLSLLAWSNFSALIDGNNQSRKAQRTTIVIGKSITEQNMAAGAENYFTQAETDLLKNVSQVEDVGAILPAQFPIYATIGGSLALTTDLPIACIPDRFIEHLPQNWSWNPGSRNLPVILSTQFLDIYNYVFAPGQGLPQLSRASVQAIAIKLQAGGENGRTLSGYITGFTDEVGSILVPQSFIEYGNTHYSNNAVTMPSQLILKVKDPSDIRFTNYLKEHEYTTNPQNLRWSKMRGIAEVVTSATGGLALLIMGMSALIFILFIELTIVRAKDALLLLQQLGYSNKYLRQTITKRFLPVAAATMCLALLVATAIQIVLAQKAKENGLALSAIPSWQFWVVFSVCVLLFWLLIVRSVRRALKS